MSGNLSHQIEHHLFPDMPANRYKEVAPKIRPFVQNMALITTKRTLCVSSGVYGYVWRNVHYQTIPLQK